MQDGTVCERAAVNISVVHGTVPQGAVAEMRNRLVADWIVFKLLVVNLIGKYLNEEDRQVFRPEKICHSLLVVLGQ